MTQAGSSNEHLRDRDCAAARASLDRGEGSTIRTEEELTAYFDRLEERGRKRLEAEKLRQKIDQGRASLERGDVTMIEKEEDEKRFFDESIAGLPKDDAGSR